MTPINNSDLAWLIVADYNQDNNIGFPIDLREDVLNPETNNWCSEFTLLYEVGHEIGWDVGSGDIEDDLGLSQEHMRVGYATPTVGSFRGNLVGGNHFGWTNIIHEHRQTM